MVDYFLIVVVCLLSFYGAWCILRDISSLGLRRNLIEKEGSRLVFLVKNKEDSIEGILHVLMNSTSGYFNELIVMDMGSTDETYKILLKLSEKYGNLKILSKEEKDKIFCE